MKLLLAPLLCATLAGCGQPMVAATCVPNCAAGFQCQDGACVLAGGSTDGGGPDQASAACMPACGGATPFCNASGSCVSCLTDDQCPSGHYCKTLSAKLASCVPGCTDDSRCGGMKCCGMSCVDLTTSSANCGMCGMSCSAAHAEASCAASKCSVAGCDPGWGDCNANAGDGCEANLHVDPANCGGCGMGCALPQAIPGCSDGCYIEACNFGFGDCNGDDKDGCETPTTTDPQNCGGCGAPCNALPNAQASCVAGNCVLGACNNGFVDCDRVAANGCEANFNSDPKNCGKCGMTCPQNLPGCFGGVCVARFQFQQSQTIDGQTVTCSKVDNSNNLYTECDDLLANGLYFPNGINCGPMWSMTQCQYSDTFGFCQALTGKAQAESYYTCGNTTARASWHNHVWTMVMDNGFTQNLRCYY